MNNIDREDIERYRWLKPRLIGADFNWNESRKCVLVFEWPSNVAVGGNCDQNIDAARLGAPVAQLSSRPGAWDEKALEVARRFTPEIRDGGALRARLQVAVLDAMRSAHSYGPCASAAVRTLHGLGYTWHGGGRWLPRVSPAATGGEFDHTGGAAP